MRVVKEIRLREFDFWGGAKQTAELLSDDDFDFIESILEENETPPTETDINDLFWFESDYIAEVLGFEDYEALYEARKDYVD